jgi:hypothetical protein
VEVSSSRSTSVSGKPERTRPGSTTRSMITPASRLSTIAEATLKK